MSDESSSGLGARDTETGWSLARRLLQQARSHTVVGHQVGNTRRLALMLGIGTIAGLSLVSSYLRDLTLTSAFGISRTLDIYLLALAVPQVLGVEASNVAVAVLLPKYADQTGGEGRPTAGHILRRDYLRWGAGLVLLSIALGISSDLVARFLAAGLETTDRAEVATGIASLSPLVTFLGLAGVGRAWLDAQGRLWVGATFPVLRSLGIAGLILVVWLFRQPQLADAVAGALLGGLVALLWATMSALRNAPASDGHAAHSAGRHYTASSLAMLSGGSVLSQSADFVDKSLASHLGPGQVSALSIAYSLIQIPMALILNAFSTVAFPEFARLRARETSAKARTALSGYFALLVLLLTPVVLVFVLIPDKVVALAFGTARLGIEGATLAGLCLSALSIGQLPYVGAILERQYLFASRRYGLTTLAGVISLGAKLGMSIYLVRNLGAVGLALATSVGHFVSLVVLSTLTNMELRRESRRGAGDGLS